MTNQTTKPVASGTKKLLTSLGVAVTVVGLTVGTNIISVQASTDEKFITVADVSAGDTFATILTDDGTVYSRGWNSQGQLGVAVGSTVNVDAWTPVEIEERIVDIDSSDHTVALGESGSIYSWGPNQEGQIGVGNTNPAYVPQKITATLRYDKISAGENFVVALDNEGRLWSWGANTAGQLGNNTTEPHTEPTVVETATKFRDLYTGPDFVLALDNDGNLWGWGSNDSGQLGDGTTEPKLTPTRIETGNTWSTIATNIASDTVLGIDSNGWLFSWGANVHGELGTGVDWRKQQQEENERVERLIAEIQAEDENRKLELIEACVWEREEEAQAEVERQREEQGNSEENSEGVQLRDEEEEAVAPTPTPTPTPSPTTPTIPDRPVITDPTDSEFYEDCEATVEETFEYTDTSNIKPRIIPEPELKPGTNRPELVTNAYQFKNIAVGTQNAYAIDVLGRLYGWGSDKNGQSGINVDEETHTQVPVQIATNIADVAGGDKYATAVGTDSSLYVWGLNTDGVLLSNPNDEPKLTTPTKKADGFNSVTAGLTTVYGTRSNTSFAWGSNQNGQVGAGLTENTVTTPVETTIKASIIAPYRNGAVGVGLSNQLLFWGLNENGEHGLGSTDTTPVREASNRTVDKFLTVKAGYWYSLAVDESGQVWGWGMNDTHLVDFTGSPDSKLYPVTLPLNRDITQVTAGKTISAAASDTTLYVWSSTTPGQVAEYEIPTPVTQLDSGDKHVAAITEDGRLWVVAETGAGLVDVEPGVLTELDTENTYKQVAAGGNSVIAVTDSGEIVGFGENRNNIFQSDTPLPIVVEHISTTGEYVIAVSDTKVPWGWGVNEYQVLGTKTTHDTPTALPLSTEEGTN